MNFYTTLCGVLFFLFGSAHAWAMQAPAGEEISPNFARLQHPLRAACASFLEVNKSHPLSKDIAVKLLAKQASYAWFFNTSVARDVDGNYIIASRFSYLGSQSSKEDPELKVIPGNHSDPRDYTDSEFEYGENFLWHNWRSFGQGTLYFKAKARADNGIDLSAIQLLAAEGPWLNKADVRLHAYNGHIYAHDPRSRDAYLAKVEIRRCAESGVLSINFVDTRRNNLYHNNHGLIHVNDESFFYVDWFYKDFDGASGVRFLTINKHGQQEGALKILPFVEGYAFDGFGESNSNGIIPLISLGSNHIEDKDNPQKIFGVGHLKIEANPKKHPYKEGSNIKRFRDFINNELKEKMGDKLIRYEKQFYLTYFYSIEFDAEKNPIKMMMSNPFSLFTNTQRYNFILNFPTSICYRDDKTCIIGAGDGDYSPMVYEFNLDYIRKSLIHDVSKMDFNNLEYFFLKFRENGGAKILGAHAQSLPELCAD